MRHSLTTSALLCTLCLVFVQLASASPHHEHGLRPPNRALATLIAPTDLYVAPTNSSSKLATLEPGREMVINEQNGDWLRVFANVDPPESMALEQPELPSANQPTPISGWVPDRGLVTAATPNGDQILFGAAEAQEDAASETDPPPGAAMAARLLYQRVVEMFPQSRLVPEAIWRAADIRWQLQKAEVESLPSAEAQQSYLREQMDENEMRYLLHHYRHTRWAAMAAFAMLDNQLCGAWQGTEKCPEREADLYLHYAGEYPDSPRAPQALYNAAWREAAAGDMWQADGNPKRAAQDRHEATSIAAELEQKYPQSNEAFRAATLAYKVAQGMAVYAETP